MKIKNGHICPVTGMEFVTIPEGEFEMGDVWGDGKENEKPIHLVTLPTFQMAKYPVTQGQWLQVMVGVNPATSSGEKFVGPDKPVINVSWDDAQEFIQLLNRKSGSNYRLPSEAEWEYAARSGGGRDKYSGAANTSDLASYAWFKNNSGRCYDKSIQPVGWKRPNILELYDMSGNVWEWCADVWHDNYIGAPSDGSAWDSDGDPDKRVLRGGSWAYSARSCRATSRNGFSRGLRFNNIGFRLVKDFIKN